MFLIILILIPTIFFLNKLYGKNFSFLMTLKPANLAFEMNESQRINFLSVERKFILPYPVRLFVYNEPGLALAKIVSQFTSFFDIEQLTAPDKTYEIVKLSGISPKGNLMLFYIWEIPLIIYGIFKLREKDYIAKLFLISIIPFLFFEKKLLAQTAFLTIVPILTLEAIGISELIKKTNKKLIATGLLIAVVSVFGFYKTLLTKPLSYQSPQPYLFREIARWIVKNYDPNKNYVVTTKFGPTEIMTPYYLGRNYQNLTFESFDLRQESPRANTVYLGLAGEFVKPSRNLDKIDPPGAIEILGKIEGEDEPVFEYGKNIWIGYSK